MNLLVLFFTPRARGVRKLLRTFPRPPGKPLDTNLAGKPGHKLPQNLPNPRSGLQESGHDHGDACAPPMAD